MILISSSNKLICAKHILFFYRNLINYLFLFYIDFLCFS